MDRSDSSCFKFRMSSTAPASSDEARMNSDKRVLVMVTHFKLGGHLACGREGKTLKTSTDSGRVTCRNCRHTDAYLEARQATKDAGPGDAQLSGNWRNTWRDKLSGMPGTHRLPRGFSGQQFV